MFKCTWGKTQAHMIESAWSVCSLFSSHRKVTSLSVRPLAMSKTNKKTIPDKNIERKNTDTDLLLHRPEMSQTTLTTKATMKLDNRGIY